MRKLFHSKRIYTILTIALLVVGAFGIQHVRHAHLTKSAEALVQHPCDPDVGCTNTCVGVTSDCTSNAQCGANEQCLLDDTTDCPRRTCQCYDSNPPQCGTDICGNAMPSCANGQMCSGGKCVAEPPYCPRTDNPNQLGSVSLVASKDAAANPNLKITSSWCPIGSVAQVACSSLSNNQSGCTSAGCSYTPDNSFCTPNADQVDCSTFGTRATCTGGSATAAKGQCAWMCIGGTGVQSAAAAGLAIISGGCTEYDCETKTTLCDETTAATCNADPACTWYSQPAQCFGNPTFKTASTVNVGKYTTAVYQKRRDTVTNWDYESCSFWRCTTKNSSDSSHTVDDTCANGQGCGWADGCVIRACSLTSSAQVSAAWSNGAAPSGGGWTLTTQSIGGTLDTSLLNTCWGSNPTGTYIPAPGCGVLANGVCPSPTTAANKNTCASGDLANQAFDGTTYTWSCTGEYGGSNSPTCSYSTCTGARAVCSTTAAYQCTQGVGMSGVSGPTTDTWKCNSTDGCQKADCSIVSSCTGPDGATINNGASRSYYNSPSVPYGSSCSSKALTCTDGVLTAAGGYTYASCVVAGPLKCTGPDSSVIADGDSKTYYQAASVPFGSSCVSQVRTCSNGTLSGSYGNASCSVVGPKDCIGPDGSTMIAHGASKTYYSAASVACGSSCAPLAETRTCNNGVLSGSNTNASCVTAACPPPVTGVCAATHYNCAPGSSSGGYADGTNWNWECLGSNGGADSPLCQEPEPVDGVCNGAHYFCNAGTVTNKAGNGSVGYSWTCAGLYHGKDTNCTQGPDPVDGLCSSPQVHYTCASGTAGNNSANVNPDYSTTYSWNCLGQNGGSTASCSETTPPPTPVDGNCGSPETHYACTAGNSTGGYDAGDRFKWNCLGLYGGKSSACEEMKPVPGICSTPEVHYTCATPPLATGSIQDSTAGKWKWTCPGQYGGSSASCEQAFPPIPTVAWDTTPASGDPASMAVGYGDGVSYGYHSSGADSCELYEVDWNTGAIVNDDGAVATAHSWSGAVYTSRARRRLTCTNVAGSSSTDLFITVLSNDSSCISVSPSANYVLPGDPFSASIVFHNPLGTKTWNGGDSTPHGITSVANGGYPAWPAADIHVTGTVPAGSNGNFTYVGTAPASENDYAFAWRMYEDLVPRLAFGPVCTSTAPGGPVIHVKKATLAVDQRNLDFGTVVLGDTPPMKVLTVRNLGGGTIDHVLLSPVPAPFTCPDCSVNQIGPGGVSFMHITMSTAATGSFPMPPNPTILLTADLQAATSVSMYGTVTDKLALCLDAGCTKTVGSIDFGDAANPRFVTRSFWISNRSLDHAANGAVSVTNSPIFSCVSGCSYSLPPGAQPQKVTLKFAPPKTPMPFAANAHLSDSTQPIDIPLSGNGVAPEFVSHEK